MKDTLLPAVKQVTDTSRSSSSSWLSPLGLLFLTFNSGMAIPRSRNDPWSVAIPVSTFHDLLLLFFCLHKFEKTPHNSPMRTHLKIAVWCLSMFLTVIFSYRVAALMPLAVAIVVWAMSLSTMALPSWPPIPYLNSGMAIHQYRNDPWLVAFVVSTFLDLLLLFFCLHKFEKTPRNSPMRSPQDCCMVPVDVPYGNVLLPSGCSDASCSGDRSLGHVAQHHGFPFLASYSLPLIKGWPFIGPAMILGWWPFLVSTFHDLLLFFCPQKFEKTPRNSLMRTHLKIVVWCLSTFLTVSFSYWVASLMPLAVAIVVWAMSLSTIGAGFYLFFIYREEKVEKNVSSGDVKPAMMVEGP